MMRIKQDTPTVYYRQVKQKIIDQITSGELKPGDRLPSERKLCELLAVSRTTIRKAIDDLVSAGTLVRMPGKGTYISGSGPAVSKRTGNIAFIRCIRRSRQSSIMEDIFYPKVLTGLETAIAAHDYHCIVQTINENEYDLRILENLAAKVDGIVCAELRNERFLEHILAMNLPVVLISPSVVARGVDIVGVDNVDGAIQAVNHLLDLGHQRIAYIGGSPSSRSSREREDGYVQALLEAGISSNDSMRLSRGWRIEDGYSTMITLLSVTPRATAVFAASDLLAIGAIHACQEMGVKVPDDISIIGFDDIDIAATTKPSLSTMRVLKGEMGEVAGRLILERLTGKRSYPLKVRIPAVLIERASTKVLVITG